MFAPKRILVPTDFTSDSDTALQEAVEIAKVFHSKVFLIHVDDSIQEASGGDALGLDVIEEADRSDARVATEKMRTEIRKVAQETEVDIAIAERHGTTYAEILEFGTEKGVDLIVIEPHIKRGLQKILRGGVVEQLIQHSRTPVLVLR